MIKHCVNCGKDFEAENNYVKLCEDCREDGKDRRKKDNLTRMVERKKSLGLRSASLYGKDIDLLKSIKDNKETLADAFHYILKYYVDKKNNQ